MIQAVFEVNSKGVIHNDINAENFCLPDIPEFVEERNILTDSKEQSEANPALSEIYLIDFELSSRVIDQENHCQTDEIL